MTRPDRGPVLQQRVMFRLLFFLVSPGLVAASRRTPSRLFGRISENSPTGTTVDGVELLTGPGPCSDEELAAGLTGNHAADFRLFWHQRNRLSLVSNTHLDREFIHKYELRVALSCLRTPAVVEVAVLASEAALRRRSRSLTAEPTYAVTVAEHARAGDLVFTVPDPRFARRRFELTSRTEPPVQVEQNTGRVFLTRPLSEPADVLVKILKVPGDEWYVCRLSLSVSSQAALQWTMFPSPYLAVASPDVAPGSVVYRLSSRQPEGTPGPVRFLLLDGGMGCFEVDHQTGEIRTTGLPLTYNTEYLLRVMVKDGLGQRGPEACVSVLAGSRPPQFTECPPVVTVPEDTEPAQCVAVFRAVSFQNKALSFVLVDPGNIFVLQKETGSLCLGAGVDYESGNNKFTLRVRAWETDTGLSSECEVTLSITDVNDCTPEFSYPVYTHNNVLENVALGTSLLQVVAQDCDSGMNSQISYVLEDERFLVSSDGVISPARRLDYEQSGRFYAFVVVAVDAGSPPRTGSASVHIRVSSGDNDSSERVCPAGQLTVFRESGQRRCVPSPCGAVSCQNGGTCSAEPPDSFKCLCPEGFRGRHCQLGQVKGHVATLSPSSILMVSMSLLVFFALLVAVTVWNQKGSRNKFRQRATLPLPVEQLSHGEVPGDLLSGSEAAGKQRSAEEASCIVSCSSSDPSLPRRHKPASEDGESDELESHEALQSDVDSDTSHRRSLTAGSLGSVWCHN